MSARVRLLDRLLGPQADASHPRRQVWLSASAGTGKTHVLTARVLRLLLNGAAPEAILCLTFTKAGAAEMAERIQSRLAAWVRMREQDLRKELYNLGEPNGPDALRAARRLFARTLDAPGGGLRIQTIHAFAQTLLAGFPAEAGLMPGFRPLDGRAEAALQRATLGRLLVEAERGGDLGLIADVQALSRRLGEAGAEDYLRLCARSIEPMRALGAREGIEARVRRGLDVPLGDVETAIAEACADDAHDCASLDEILAANRAWGTARGIERAEAIGRWRADPAQRHATLHDLHLVWATKDGSPRSFGKGQAPQDEKYAELAMRLHGWAADLLGLRARAELAGAIAAGLRAGQAYALAYAAAKRTAGAVDFDDLIRFTVGLLAQPGIGEWIRYKLDRRTDHVLIDEGQDTNASQWAIVRALADEFFVDEPAVDDPRPRVRTLFSVGDFKQAIFGFQGTDPLFFAAARQHFTNAAREGEQLMEWLSLDRSFRSTPPILAVVDRVVANLGQAALGLQDAPEPHVSAQPGQPGTVTLWRPVTAETAESDEAGEEDWIDDATRLFAGKLAKQVKAWIEAPLWLPAAGRPLRPEDVLILVRKRGALAALIVARLHAEGVAVAGIDRLRLDAPLAVQDLVAAMRFVLQPDDDLTLANLLVSPLFGWSQDDLYRLAFGRGGSLWSALAADPVGGAAADALRALLNAADFTTPHRFLETILSGPIDGRRKLLRRLGEEARDPIDELVNAALTFETEATPTLQRFLDWFDRGEVVIARDPSAPLDAVRVITAHGAKGLEAPLVILADATGDPDLQRAGRIDWAIDGEAGAAVPVIRPRKAEMAGPLGAAADALALRERQEHWRLLYVAATRAREYLVIGGALGPRAKGVAPAASWHAALDRALEGLGAELVDDPAWGSARHYRGDRPAAARTGVAKPPAAIRPAPPLPEWLHAPAPQEARPPRPLAPSSLGEDRAADPPPTAALREAARRGRLLHALFERLPAVTPDTRETSAIHWLQTTGGLDEAAARRLAGEACAIVADPAFRDVFAPEALAEAPIAAVIAGGIVVAGTVDRLLVEEDRVLVVDFKTGRRVPATAEDAPEAHLRQMAAYEDALAAIFPGRRIEAALLYSEGPRLLALAPALLARHKPGLEGVQQKLAPES